MQAWGRFPPPPPPPLSLTQRIGSSLTCVLQGLGDPSWLEGQRTLPLSHTNLSLPPAKRARVEAGAPQGSIRPACGTGGRGPAGAGVMASVGDSGGRQGQVAVATNACASTVAHELLHSRPVLSPAALGQQLAEAGPGAEANRGGSPCPVRSLGAGAAAQEEVGNSGRPVQSSGSGMDGEDDGTSSDTISTEEHGMDYLDEQQVRAGHVSPMYFML